MGQYEVTFIVDPVLSGDEIKATADKFVDFLKENNCEIVHIDEMGLRQLAYPVNKRNSGIYYCVEFKSEIGKIIADLELNMKREERLLRFLTVSLDKYGVKYNADKRAGLIGKKKQDKDTPARKDAGRAEGPAREARKETPKPAAKEEAPKEKPVAKEEAAKEKPAPKEEKVKEVSKPEVKEEAAPTIVPEEVKPDDLKKIEGIGPKIEGLLNEAGIATFVQLSAASEDSIREILTNAGSRFQMHDPSTWPNQAKLASEGNWDELQKLQDELKGGRETDTTEEE